MTEQTLDLPKRVPVGEYAQVTAIVTHAAIKLSLEKAYPELTGSEHDQIFLTIVDRIARLRGYSLKYEGALLRGTLEEDSDP